MTSPMAMEENACISRCPVPYSSPYTALDRRRKDIRLLHILPQTQDGKIHCSTITTRLESAPHYSALSYAWGLPVSKHNIILNGVDVPVRQSLYNFLARAQRWPYAKDRLYWVDALCIDQENDPERSHQVLLMADIFSGADRVLAWLGPASKDSDLAMRCVASGASFRRTKDKTKTKLGCALLRLYSRPYWTRLWILQELALAKSVFLICGEEQAAWETETAFPKSSGTPGTQKSDHDDINGILRSPAASMFRLIHQSHNESTLYEQVILTRHLRCADLRDKIYALLGLPHIGGEDIQPDYSAGVGQILNKVIRDHHLTKPPSSLSEVEGQCKDLTGALNIHAKVLHESGAEERLGMSQLEQSYNKHTAATQPHLQYQPVFLGTGSQNSPDSGINIGWIIGNRHQTIVPLWSLCHNQDGQERLQVETILHDTNPWPDSGLDMLFQIFQFPKEDTFSSLVPQPSASVSLTRSLPNLYHRMDLIEDMKAVSILELLTAVETDAKLCTVLSVDYVAHCFLPHIAAFWGKPRTLSLLLDQDYIDVNAKDVFGRTPLAIAVWLGRSKITELLLTSSRTGPNILVQGIQNTRNQYGDGQMQRRVVLPKSTALHVAVELQQTSCLEVLLDCSAVDVNIKNAEGDSALHIMCKSQDPQVQGHLELLLSRLDLDINSKDDDGNTPLLLMCQHQTMWSVALKLLIERPQDLDTQAKNTLGDTMLDVLGRKKPESLSHRETHWRLVERLTTECDTTFMSWARRAVHYPFDDRPNTDLEVLSQLCSMMVKIRMKDNQRHVSKEEKMPFIGALNLRFFDRRAYGTSGSVVNLSKEYVDRMDAADWTISNSLYETLEHVYIGHPWDSPLEHFHSGSARSFPPRTRSGLWRLLNWNRQGLKDLQLYDLLKSFDTNKPFKLRRGHMSFEISAISRDENTSDPYHDTSLPWEGKLEDESKLDYFTSPFSRLEKGLPERDLSWTKPVGDTPEDEEANYPGESFPLDPAPFARSTMDQPNAVALGARRTSLPIMRLTRDMDP